MVNPDTTLRERIQALTSVGVLGACALLVLSQPAHAQLAQAGSNSASSDIRGQSDQISLQDFTADTRLAQSVAQLVDSERNVRKTAARAARQVRDALAAFEKEPTFESEMRLARVNAQVMADQDAALGEFQTRLQSAAQFLDEFSGDIDNALGDFATQSQDIVSRHDQSTQRATEIHQNLKAIATRMDELLDARGELPPKIEASVLVLNAILRGEQTQAANAIAENEVIDADIRQLQQVRDSLVRETAVLLSGAETISAHRAFLAGAATRQANSAERSGELARAAAVWKELRGLDVLGTTRQLPVIAATVQRADMGIQARKSSGAVDILRAIRQEVQQIDAEQ